MQIIRSTQSWIEFDAFRHNIDVIRKYIRPQTKVMAVIKANAYGHGIVRVGQYLDQLDTVHHFGVAIPEEGRVLRSVGIAKPILVLGPTDPEHVNMVVTNDLTPAVFRLDVLSMLQEEARLQEKILPVHVKVDSGMNRIGAKNLFDFDLLVQAIEDSPNIRFAGIFTHFAKSESDPDFTDRQYEVFMQYVKRAKELGHDPIIHCCNSGGIFQHPDKQCDMVRLGISLYGYHPDPQKTLESGLRQPLSWHTRVTNIKTIYPGEGVSYGLRFIADSPRRIATLPVGYGDGYKRCMSGRTYVLIHGRRAPQVGTICMDQTMVDVSDIPDVHIGDDVVLIGKQGDEIILADELAGICDTISYEVLLSISERVPRIYKRADS
ncbi:MAG: alanine racemase [Clostridia bacterium]|nr:alanine racemase [Clostridia bacterium]